MKKFFINLLDWIYKKKCYICGSSKESVKICSNCYREMEYLQNNERIRINGIEVYCCGEYSNKLQKIIRGLKYHNQKDLAYYQAKFMHEYWQNVISSNNHFQVVPVPLFKTREKSRRYNHMTLVAEEFCNLTGYELNTELIKRIKDTKPQYKLNRSQRMKNLANAFEVNKNALKPFKIMLIDDICTTGTTFENIIIELQKHDINDIVCLATTTPIIGE